MKIIAISDTHGLHKDLDLPEGDVLVHAGDFSYYEDQPRVVDFLAWLDRQDFEHKILIGGNHDFVAAERPDYFQQLLPESIIYLYNSGTTIDGIRFWGSPYQPDLKGWAFGEDRGEPMRKHWQQIPNDTNILVTHTPPFGILDESRSGRRYGCEELSKRLEELSVNVHIFGHIHSGYGQQQIGKTIYINAANYNSNKGLTNPPLVFEV
ncbi:MAG: metallophosphatase domain-containing protein [Bacteroidota bacterium]